MNVSELQLKNIELSEGASENVMMGEANNIMLGQDILEESFFLKIDDIIVSDVINQLEHQFQSISLSKDIELNIYRSASVPSIIKSDFRVFKEIIFWLADFAIRHTPSGEVEIFFNTVKKNKEEFIEIKATYTDTVDYTEDRIAVMKFLTQLLYGEISVNAKFVGGSFAVVLIPLNTVSSAFPDINITYEESSLYNKKLLIAEDNFQYAKLFMQLLKNKNIAFDHVFNGREALKQIEHNWYDLIIMDLQMPEMTGLETIAAIRLRNDDKATIPVIVVTAMIDADTREICMQAGFDEFLNKPFFPGEFFEKILKLLLKRNIVSDNYSENKVFCQKNLTSKTNKEISYEAKLDFSYLKAFSKGDKEFEKDMLISTLTEIEEKLEELKNRVFKKNAAGIKKSAHSLKSLSSIAGCDQLYNYFKILEAIPDEEKSCITSIKYLEDIYILWANTKSKLLKEIENNYS